MTDIRDLLGEGFPAVERGSIKVFPDGLPAEWFKFLDESPWFIKGMSPEHAMQIASMLATDAFLTIQIWANEAWRQRELRRELAAALRERDQALAAVERERDRWEWMLGRALSLAYQTKAHSTIKHVLPAESVWVKNTLDGLNAGYDAANPAPEEEAHCPDCGATLAKNRADDRCACGVYGKPRPRTGRGG